ncbi:hypothetical protein SRB5_53820 [Streptomyces sp. RB5]|uniref:histidine kinase n=1 Tax=Streptomyces smaragdinus TaxID=2585196 RepID=A0A7K0CPG7_9ACTN|nr:sensor histidine kinase [Streptomyces smaragdinus]MQY15203.1 hypothetical protein [Streptomyces smaragdinus]
MKLNPGVRAVAGGLPVVGLALAEVVVFSLFLTGVSLIGIGIGVLLVPVLAAAVRATADASRGMARKWGGVEIASPYPPEPAFSPGLKGRWEHTQWILSDPATWRDLTWMLINPLAGVTLALLPVTLVVGGLGGVLMPLIYEPISDNGGNWYLWVEITDLSSAWYASALGVLTVVGGLLVAPAAQRWYAGLAGTFLAPTRTAERMRHLTETRTDAVNTSAAELRRIERDLHDGAQARLVALGMNLSVAERLLAKDPEAVRNILADTRKASAAALTELRDLVRGIHPPVLADRGLADAVRALALDSPLDVTVNADLPGRAEAPVESAMYFAVAESLTNAAKHASPTHVTIDLWYEDGVLRGQIADDGNGGADPSRGTGLRGIERRLAAFDGVLAVHSKAGAGTTLTMELPCELS